MLNQGGEARIRSSRLTPPTLPLLPMLPLLPVLLVLLLLAVLPVLLPGWAERPISGSATLENPKELAG